MFIIRGLWVAVLILRTYTCWKTVIIPVIVSLIFSVQFFHLIAKLNCASQPVFDAPMNRKRSKKPTVCMKSWHPGASQSSLPARIHIQVRFTAAVPLATRWSLVLMKTLAFLDSPCGQLEVRRGAGAGAGANTHRFSSAHPAHFYASSPTQRDNLEQHASLREKEKRVHAADAAGGSTPSDTSRDRPATAEPDRKRQLERDCVIQVKRVKTDTVDDEFGSSATFHTDQSSFSMRHAHPSLRITPVRHINIRHPSLMDPDSSRCSVGTASDGLLSYPGAEIYPYQTASWEPLWEVPNPKDVLRDHSLNTCKALRQAEAFSGFFTPPLYTPLSLRVQETAYLTGRQNLHFHQRRSQLQHPGFLAMSCLRPWVSSVLSLNSNHTFYGSSPLVLVRASIHFTLNCGIKFL